MSRGNRAIVAHARKSSVHLTSVQANPHTTSTQISALRQTRVVMLDGKLLDADALRKAAGYSGRPK
jgi:hypothetical protein